MVLFKLFLFRKHPIGFAERIIDIFVTQRTGMLNVKNIRVK
jgi:hypothetical protein